MSYPFKNLVFEGGGVKGIAYVGALKVLERKGILPNIQRIGGTSAGAINAVLLALGYDEEETLDILLRLNFKNFMDDSWGIIRDSKRLIDKYGWYKGDYFRKWIGSIIADKAGHSEATFKELKTKGFKDLYLVGTNLSTRFSEVFSAEHTPRIQVAEAVRISMSIPLFFQAVRNLRQDVYVDGGVFNNYPIKLFDRLKYIDPENHPTHTRTPDYYEEENKSFNAKHPNSSPLAYNKETLGFRLDTKQEIAVFRDGAEPVHTHINDFFDYAKALLGAILNVQNNFHLKSDDWQRTIYIDTMKVGTTDFNMKKETKKRLIKKGEEGTTDYFEWYDDTQNDLAVNHPLSKD